MRKCAIQWLSVLIAFATMRAVAETLTIAFEPQWGGKALPFGQMVLTNAPGQTLSVTRLDFLVSDFAIRRSDGTWLCDTNGTAFLSLGQGRTRFKVSMLRAGTY